VGLERKLKGEVKMADRMTVRYDELELFKEFLLYRGFELEEPKGEYEVLRARYKGKKGNKKQIYKKTHIPLILFRRDRGCHFTLNKPYDDGLDRSFIDWKCENKKY
jgi:hypothetical protein